MIRIAVACVEAAVITAVVVTAYVLVVGIVAFVLSSLFGKKR